jgi:uncharacterized sodium:solute symporter family permease YidK
VHRSVIIQRVLGAKTGACPQQLLPTMKILPLFMLVLPGLIARALSGDRETSVSPLVGGLPSGLMG